MKQILSSCGHHHDRETLLQLFCGNCDMFLENMKVLRRSWKLMESSSTSSHLLVNQTVFIATDQLISILHNS